MGPVNLACAIRFAETGSYHSAWGSLVLVGSGHRAWSGRLVPPAGAKPKGVAGLNRVWDGTSGEWAYVERLSICRAFCNIPGNKNRFESLSLPGIEHVKYHTRST